MRHHTKDKGDKGLANVIADLISKGIQVCLPISEHLPFDLIAVKQNGSLHRVSVKYRQMYRGAVTVSFSSYYSDSNGFHSKATDKTMIDLMAIYCPETNQVYYLNPLEFTKSVTLRVDAVKNNQSTGVHFANKYLTIP